MFLQTKAASWNPAWKTRRKYTKTQAQQQVLCPFSYFHPLPTAPILPRAEEGGKGSPPDESRTATGRNRPRAVVGSHRKGVIFLSEMEKKLADSLAKAAAALPESKREFLLGYAEGVAAMTEAKAPAAPAVEDKPEEPAS